jgi:hypothetical protein
MNPDQGPMLWNQADVDEIRAFLTRTCEDASRWLPGTGWSPAWQSEAEGEVRNGELRNDGSPWGEAPVRTAYAAATVFPLRRAGCPVGAPGLGKCVHHELRPWCTVARRHGGGFPGILAAGARHRRAT